MNKKFTYKAVLYSYNEDDRDYNLFSEKKDDDNLLKIKKTFIDEVGLKKNCFELASFQIGVMFGLNLLGIGYCVDVEINFIKFQTRYCGGRLVL